MKVISINFDRCSGCRLCELACSLKMAGEFNPAKARIHVIGFEEVFALPMTCFQCEKPYCAEVCPARAIDRNDTSGIVSVSDEKCVGCKICTVACPFGSIVFSSDNKVAVKCEQCDGEPECVAFCPTGALEFQESDIAMLRKQRSWQDKLKDLYDRGKNK